MTECLWQEQTQSVGRERWASGKKMSLRLYEAEKHGGDTLRTQERAPAKVIYYSRSTRVARKGDREAIPGRAARPAAGTTRHSDHFL